MEGLHILPVFQDPKCVCHLLTHKHHKANQQTEQCSVVVSTGDIFGLNDIPKTDYPDRSSMGLLSLYSKTMVIIT